MKSMGQSQIQKFSRIQELFQCPLCREKIYCEHNSLLCGNGHCFDIAAKGYVNFIPQQKSLQGYTQNFFTSRRKILELGFYSHILSGIQQYIGNNPALKTIVDAGCGDGYYAKHIQAENGVQVIAFDVAKEAVQIAAKGGNAVCWLVADIANIPLQSRSADCILDIFTPANYGEFARVLRKDGIVIKVVPGTAHLQELRHAMRNHLQHETYSNADVVEHFASHFHVAEKQTFTKTLAVTEDQLNDFMQMTPLLFGIEEQVIKNCKVSDITIAAEVLIGKQI